MNWRTWTAAGLLIVALFAIYTFAAPDSRMPAGDDPLVANGRAGTPRTGAQRVADRQAQVTTPGVEGVRLDLLEADSGSYRSDRNLFAYKEPPPPPPPPAPKPPPPPPDKDKDGVPDYQDNCVSVANADQQDIDRDGIGTACESEQEIAPPPPPPPVPQPDRFDYKFIGMFGPANNPIATFARDGDIVNVRAGETIDGKFVLRSIGIESVEIGFVGFPPDVRQRIPIGQ